MNVLSIYLKQLPSFLQWSARQCNQTFLLKELAHGQDRSNTRSLRAGM